MNQRGVAARWPVLLGGAALTRAYVEQDLAEIYEGEVRYARDAFEGLRLMDAVDGASSAACPAPTLPDAARAAGHGRRPSAPTSRRSRTCRPARTSPIDNPVPTPPFWGDRASSRASRWPTTPPTSTSARSFLGQWGLAARARRRRAVVRGAGRDRGPAAAAALAGPAPDRGPARGGRRLRLLPVLSRGRRPRRPADHEGAATAPERARFTFPRQRRDRHLCLADFFRPDASPARSTSSRFHVVTMGTRVVEATGELFAANAYRDYLELHGLSVQLTEALAEYWHARVRDELGLRRRGRPRPGRGLPAGLPRLALLLRLPGLPGPRGPGQARRAAATRSGSASSCPRSSSCTRSSRPTRSIVHHPEAKYFNATMSRCARCRRRGAVRHGRAARRHRALLVRRRAPGHGRARARAWTDADTGGAGRRPARRVAADMVRARRGDRSPDRGRAAAGRHRWRRCSRPAPSTGPGRRELLDDLDDAGVPVRARVARRRGRSSTPCCDEVGGEHSSPRSPATRCARTKPFPDPYLHGVRAAGRRARAHGRARGQPGRRRRRRRPPAASSSPCRSLVPIEAGAAPARRGVAARPRHRRLRGAWSPPTWTPSPFRPDLGPVRAESSSYRSVGWRGHSVAMAAARRAGRPGGPARRRERPRPTTATPASTTTSTAHGIAEHA